MGEIENVSSILEDDALRKKADMKDLVALSDMKSNKVDTEMLLQCVKIQHQQISHVGVILAECLRSMLTGKMETKAESQIKRLYLMDKITKVVQWIARFEPGYPNVHELKMPAELLKMTKQTRNHLKEKQFTESSSKLKLNPKHFSTQNFD